MRLPKVNWKLVLTWAALLGGLTSAQINGQINGSAGVSQLVAGTNVTLSPVGGTGVVTVNSTGGGSSGANPTGTVGLSAVNGAATTFLRSDGAPALSQAIVPTWTGAHTFSAGLSTTTLAASSTVSGSGFSTYLAAPPAIGSTTASTGAFTTLSASSTVSGTGFSSYLASPPAIGGTAAAAANFTTIGTTGLITTTLSGQTANTPVNGYFVNNTTLASASNQQYACMQLSGQGWKTTATAASEQVDWQVCNEPTQGSAAPSTGILFNYQINGGGYTTAMTVNTGALTATGLGASFDHIAVTGAVIPSTGMYRPATNTLGISANSLLVAAWGPTTFTVSGCGTAGSVVGIGTAGTFTVGTGAATCTFTFTINGATGLTAQHGWIANVDDVTAKIHCTNTTGGTTTTAVVLCNSTVATSDAMTFEAVPY